MQLALEKTEICCDQRLNQFPCAVAVALLRHPIDAFFQRVERIVDGNRAFAEGKKRVVVLRVTDADDVMRRQTQLGECDIQPSRLVDTGRQDHHCALVENDL